MLCPSRHPGGFAIRHGVAALLLALSLPSCDNDGGRSVQSAPQPATQVDADAQNSGPKSGQQPAAQGPIAPTTPHGFSARDLLAMDRISSPVVSPDGTRVVFVRRATDMVANKGRTSLWVVPTAGGTPKQLVDGADGDHEPRFSPDGATVYFVSKRSGTPQIWAVAANSDPPPAPHQVTDLPVAVSGLKISPDGKHLATSAMLVPECENIACTVERNKKAEADKTTGQLYDRLFVRHWDTWKDGRRAHLLVAQIGSTPTRDAAIISRGLDADVPSMPFGGSEEYTFTPDSRQIVFTAREAGGPGPKLEALSTNFDLFVATLDGAQPPRRLTQNPAWDTHPVFSPDGKTLAYVAMERAGFEADKFTVMLQTWPAGELRALTKEWDRSVRNLAFANDNELLVTANDLGHTPLFSVDTQTGAVTKRVGDGTVGSPAATADKLVFVHDDLQHPAELWTAKRDGSELKPLTAINKKTLELAHRGEAEQFSFAGHNGEKVYGWVVKPADFKPGEKYPVAFLIHGGPQGSFGNHFHYRWNPQTYAGAGYAAVFIDFHGSTGYGQAFTDSISGDWGGKPLEDLQKGLAYATEHYDFLDKERVCALGASYGGFMINWIAGKWPDRFRCLVNHDGIFDQRMMYYATEELWFPEWENGGPYYAKPDAYERFNPAHLVTRWQTPMLVIHGSLDYRVPLEQGLATFTALQRRGIESQLLHFPDENHWVLKPANSLQWHETVNAWLDKHLGK